MRAPVIRLLPCLLLALLAMPVHAQDVFQEGKPITVELMNGDKISGILESADSSKLIIRNDILGLLEIPRAAMKPPAPPEPVKPVEPWTGSFDLSLTGSEGNTDTQLFRTELDVKHDIDSGVDSFVAIFNRSETDNTATEEKFFSQLRHEWKIADSKWRPFVQGSYERNEFTSYDALYAAAAGAAYQFMDGPVHKVQGRLGGGLSHKSGSDDPDVDDNTVEALVGGDWTWQIDDVTKFFLYTDVYPAINPSGGFRSISRMTFERLVNKESAWFIKTGVDLFHDSNAGEGTDKDDWNYYVGLGRSF
jgi:hypothetical protein